MGVDTEMIGCWSNGPTGSLHAARKGGNACGQEQMRELWKAVSGLVGKEHPGMYVGPVGHWYTATSCLVVAGGRQRHLLTCLRLVSFSTLQPLLHIQTNILCCLSTSK